MKLVFSKPQYQDGKIYNIYMDSLIRSYLCYKGLQISDRDIEISYNNLYNFYDITVLKYCNSDIGNGTAEFRNNLWEQTLIKLKELFPESKFNRSWRWARKSDDGTKFYYNNKRVDHHQIPGIRFFVYAEDK